MNADCRIALYRFCRMNGWSHNYTIEERTLDDIPHVHMNVHFDDVDDIKFIPDQYTIGPVYDENENLKAIEVYQESTKLFCMYPT